MSVEQTTQLIQLILNSVLMVAVGAAVWLGLMLRWVWLDGMLRAADDSGLERTRSETVADRRRLRWAAFEPSLLATKRGDRRLKQQHQTVTFSLLTAHGSLLLLVGSTLLLALRTLVQANWLIQLSMYAFVLGLGGMLLGLGLCLTDWALSDRPKFSHSEPRTGHRQRGSSAPSSLALRRSLDPRPQPLSGRRLLPAASESAAGRRHL